MRPGFTIETHANGSAAIAVCESPLVSVAVAADRRAACLLIGRIYYRDELLRRLGVRSSDEGDAELVLRAALDQGANALQWIEGEFAAVVVRADRRLVYAVRDPLGSWPLYRAAVGGRLAIGTNLVELAARLPAASVDPEYLAGFVMYPFAGAELPLAETAVRGVERVRPGEVLALNWNGSLRERSACEWPEAESESCSAAEAGERFGELFRAAVRERVRGRSVAAHLSGGMDSSAVVCAAREQGPHALHGLSLVYRNCGLAGEAPFIHAVLDQSAAVEPHVIPGDDLLDFDWFRADVPAHDEPYGGLCQFAMEKALVDVAAKAGADTVIMGTGAEVTADGPHCGLADLLRRGRFFAALREARRWGHATNAGAFSILHRHGLSHLVPSRLRGGRARGLEFDLAAVPPWLRPDAAKRFALAARGRSFLHEVMHFPFARSADLAGVRTSAGEWAAWHLAADRGLHTGRPFLDARLVRLALSLPLVVRAVPGVAKPLLRGFANGLPDAILKRKWKANFNEVYRRGVVRNLPQLERLVNRSELCNEWFDRCELTAGLQRVASGIGSLSASGRLNGALALLAWHERFGPAVQSARCELRDEWLIGAEVGHARV